jgi:hypothetical protein
MLFIPLINSDYNKVTNNKLNYFLERYKVKLARISELFLEILIRNHMPRELKLTGNEPLHIRPLN